MGIKKIDPSSSELSPLIAKALADTGNDQSGIWFRRFLLAINLTPPLLVWHTGGAQLWVWLYAAVVHSALLYALLHPRCTWLGPILSQLSTEEKIVWLTIDDGPSDDTVEIARFLREAGISATFYLIGKNILKRPQAVEEIAKLGHTIGNHTHTHPLSLFWVFPSSIVRREVEHFDATLNRLQLRSIPSFRCPAGIKNPFLHPILRRKKVALTGWTVRAFDGVRCDVEKSLAHVRRGLHPGAILLLHEGKNDAAGRPASVELIRQVVAEVHSAGYRFA